MMTGFAFYLFCIHNLFKDEGVMPMKLLKVLGVEIEIIKNALAISTYRLSY